jgi:hypothetical protein
MFLRRSAHSLIAVDGGHSVAVVGGNGEHVGDWVMPAYGHFAGNYDFAYILHAAAAAEKRSVMVLPRNGHRMITIRVGGVVFMDSGLFIKSSLEKALVSINVDKPLSGETAEDFVVRRDRELWPIKQEFEPRVGGRWSLYGLKGLFVYERFESYGALDAMRGSWPDKSAFVSTLGAGKAPSDEDYVRCRSIFLDDCDGDMIAYMIHYCIADTTQLASVVASFRRKVAQGFGVEFYDYLTAPSLFWDAAMKALPLPDGIELLTVESHYRLFRRAIVGGTSAVVGPGYARANFEEMGPELYRPELPEGVILSLDFNSMYATVMERDSMPYENFRTALPMLPATLTDMALQWSNDSYTGFVAEVDVHLPLELHDTVKHWPLLPCHYEPREDDLSDEQLGYFTEEERRRGYYGGRKLCFHLMDIKHGVFHVAQLKDAIEKGYVITNVGQVVTFTQGRIYSDYVRRNIAARLVRFYVLLVHNINFTQYRWQPPMMKRTCTRPPTITCTVSRVEILSISAESSSPPTLNLWHVRQGPLSSNMWSTSVTECVCATCNARG